MVRLARLPLVATPWLGREYAGAKPLALLALALLLCLLLTLSLALGSASIPLDQILAALLGGQTDNPAWTNIVLKFRLPKTLTAMLAGMALGVSGLLMQTWFRNPLAEPFVLGVSSGASLGVALVVLGAGTAGGALLGGLGLAGDWLLTAAAGIGAAVSMSLVLLVATRIEQGVTLLILGLMFGYLVAALVSLLLYFALPERIQAYINWTFGSFSGVTLEQLPILTLPVVAGLLLAAALVKPLNALLVERSLRAEPGHAAAADAPGHCAGDGAAGQRGDGILRSHRLHRHCRAAPMPRAAGQF